MLTVPLLFFFFITNIPLRDLTATLIIPQKWVTFKLQLTQDTETFKKINEKLLAKEIKTGDTKLVICYNPDRAKEDKQKRAEIMQELTYELVHLQERVEKGELKHAKPIIAKAEEILRHKHGKRYFEYKVDTGKFEYWFRDEKTKQEEKLDGKFIIKTKEKEITTVEIVNRYKDLTKVEEMFKQLKDNLEVGPIYHYADRRVKAHIFVCVLALFIQKYFEEKLERAKIKISVEKAIEKLKNIKVVINQLGHLTLKYVTVASADTTDILRSVGIGNLPNILSDIAPVRYSNVAESDVTDKG